MGNIILPYSMDATVYYTTLDQYACNDGIIVGAKVGEEVVSPANGRVVNIEDTDRYGKVVTIYLGITIRHIVDNWTMLTMRLGMTFRKAMFLEQLQSQQSLLY